MAATASGLSSMWVPSATASSSPSRIGRLVTATDCVMRGCYRCPAFSRYENRCYHARLRRDRQVRMLKNQGLELVVAGNLALPGDRLVAGEIGIRDGRIAAIAEPGALNAARPVGATG